MDLFDSLHTEPGGIPESRAEAPLVVQMRPRSLDELMGQGHLLARNSPLRRLLSGQTDTASSAILFSPPGTGRTTLASLVIRAGGREYVQLSTVNAGVKEVREVIDSAKRRLNLEGKGTILLFDEAHYFSKSQQDPLLSAVENHRIVLVAATMEDPTFSVISPLLSRSLLLDLRPLDAEAISTIVERALTDSRGLGGKFQLTEAARGVVVRLASSDGQKSLTLLKAIVGGAASRSASEITTEDVAAATDTAIVRYNIDERYDVASASIKSMRGSDPDAASRYLAHMIRGGEDPHFIARRIVIAAAEDVGLADPTVLPLAIAAAQAVQLIGMPGGQIPLAEMVVAVATAPRSNRACLGINAALSDMDCGNIDRVPTPLRGQRFPGAREAREIEGSYRYPHDDPRGVLSQQYLPDGLQDKIYYRPSLHRYEVAIGE